MKLESLFVLICEIDEDDDELDESVWPKANPMLARGVVKLPFLRDLATRSANDPATRHEFRRYHCNKLAFSLAKMFTPPVWAQGDETFDVKKSIYGAADLGWKDDFAALGWCVPLDWVSIEGESKRRYGVWADVWIPRGTRRRDLKQNPYATWINNGQVRVTESEWTDTAALYDQIRKNHKKHRVKSFTYDPNNAREFAINVTNNIRVNTRPFGQYHKTYNEAFREFVIALNEGRILHGGAPVLAWAACNVVASIDNNNNIMPNKLRSIDKIDPFVAVLMAYAEALFDDTKKASKYEKEDLITLGEERENELAQTTDGPIRIGF